MTFYAKLQQAQNHGILGTMKQMDLLNEIDGFTIELDIQYYLIVVGLIKFDRMKYLIIEKQWHYGQY